MSVYTSVSTAQLENFLSRYSVGALISHEGITEGIENTNYFVTTTKGQYVLTLFESLSSEQISIYMDLTAYLSEHQVRCAHPVADKTGTYLSELNTKPAALVQRLQGKWLSHPQREHIEALGAELGKMHAAVSKAISGQSFNLVIHRRNAKWRYEMGHELLPRLKPKDRILLEDELAFQQSHDCFNLPVGIIHGDLFRDNVLFNGGQVSGLIDFYFAGRDYFLFDLAVVVNDWCLDQDCSINQDKCLALLNAYHRQRSFTYHEKDSWPLALRAAALRFWLSRLQNYYSPREGEITLQKNPDDFKKILVSHRQQQNIVEKMWI